MTAMVRGITCFPKKKHPGEALNNAILLRDIGMQGNVHQGGKRQLCLLACETKQWMEIQELKGICFHRFKENILVEGLNFSALKVETCLKLGNSIIEITEFKGGCHEQCPRIKAKLKCGLCKNTCFVAVKEGGSVAVGDRVIMML